MDKQRQGKGNVGSGKYCFACGHTLHVSAKACPNCGAHQPAQEMVLHGGGADRQERRAIIQSANQMFCRGCGEAIHVTAPQCPHCGAAQRASYSLGDGSGRNRIIAAVLAFTLGGFGAHKFYLGQIGLGILYLVFFWTFIPAIVAFVEFIIYLAMSDEEFARKYG